MVNRNTYGNGLDIKILYGVLAIVGLIVPNVFVYYEGAESGNWFLLAHPRQTIDAMFSDKIFSSVSSHYVIMMIAFFAWSYEQSKRYAIRFTYLLWVATFVFGLGFSLPLFLLIRELNKNVIKDNKSADRSRRAEASEQESGRRSSSRSGRSRSGRSRSGSSRSGSGRSHREGSSRSSSRSGHSHRSSSGRSGGSSRSGWDGEKGNSEKKDDSHNSEPSKDPSDPKED